MVTKLKEMEKSGAAAQYAELLHDTAVVSSGYEIADPSAFAKRITALMADGEAGLVTLATAAAAAGTAEAQVTTEAEVSAGAEEEIVLPEDTVESWYDSGVRLDEDTPVTPEVL